MAQRYPVDDLQAFIEATLTHYGMPEDHARIGAARMLDADRRGMSGHGIIRLPAYARRFEEGGYNVRPDIRAVRETPVSAMIDGDNGYGGVVVTKAADTAIAKASENGIAWVGVRNSNHAGAGGVYAAMALDHDLIAIYMAIGNSNHLPPWGGVDLLMSTNPIAIAVPAGNEPPLVVDMATTVSSAGRIKLAAERGETLPEGWVVDRAGRPITDPKEAHDGFLVPIGGYKGYGLGLAVGMLAGVLNGAAFGSRVVDFTTDFKSTTNTGQTIIMVRPDLFGSLDDFKAEVDERLRELKQSTPMEGQPPIRIPGDQAEARERDVREHGVELTDKTVSGLVELAERIGIEDHPFT